MGKLRPGDGRERKSPGLDIDAPASRWIWPLRKVGSSSPSHDRGASHQSRCLSAGELSRTECTPLPSAASPRWPSSSFQVPETSSAAIYPASEAAKLWKSDPGKGNQIKHETAESVPVLQSPNPAGSRSFPDLSVGLGSPPYLGVT